MNPVNPTDLEVESITRDMGFTHDQLFDTSEDTDGLYTPQYNEWLTPAQLEQAMKYTKLSRGVMLVTGDPGAGKDLWANMLCWKLKSYFKGKKIFRDDRPKELFGAYIPFTQGVLLNELSMLEKEFEERLPTEVKRTDKKTLKRISDLTQQWLSDRGKKLLQNSVLYLTEFKTYCHNRKPFSPMGILIGNIVTRWRHLDILVLGTCPQKKEIDRISILPYVTHHVKCSWMLTKPDTTECKVYFVKFVGARGVLDMRGKPKKFWLNGKELREELGGKGYYDLYISKSAASTALGGSITV